MIITKQRGYSKRRREKTMIQAGKCSNQYHLLYNSLKYTIVAMIVVGVAGCTKELSRSKAK